MELFSVANPSHPHSTLRHRAAMAFVVAFLAVQIGVPLWKLIEPRPARFGWQMFSGLRGLPEFRVVLRHGQSFDVPLGWHVGAGRSDVDYAGFLPPHLCRSYAGAAEIRVHFRSGTEQVYRCP